MIQEFQNILAKLTIVQWALLIAFILVFLLRFLYLLFFTAKVAFKKTKAPINTSVEKVSIITTVRNEEENVRKNLSAILELENGDFEVVAIDDFSQDNTLSVLGLFKQRYTRLKISSLSQETRFSVKLAQNIALKLASYNWVLFVSIASCEVKEEWIENFSRQFTNSKINLVLGYSSVSRKKGFFNLLFRIENFFQQIQSVGYIYNGIPLVYSEENVAVRKEKYYEIGGYAKNIQEPYANFELIVNSFIRKKNTIVNFNRDSAIRTNTEVHKAEYLDLLKKQLRIEKYLPFWKRMILTIDNYSRVAYFLLLALVLIVNFPLWQLISILITIHFLAQVLIIKITLKRLNECKIFIPSLVYGLLMPYYKLFFKWHFRKTSRKHKWRNGF